MSSRDQILYFAMTPALGWKWWGATGLAGSASPPQQADQTVRRILAYHQLPEGWHFGEGVRIRPESIAAALRIHGAFVAAGLRKTDTFPGVCGEVQVTAYSDRHFHEVTIRPDGSVDYYLEEDGREKGHHDGLSLDEAVLAVHELTPAKLGREWTQFGCSTSAITIPNGAVSAVWHSRIEGSPRLCRWSRSSASGALSEPAFANTSASSTPVLEVAA